MSEKTCGCLLVDSCCRYPAKCAEVEALKAANRELVEALKVAPKIARPWANAGLSYEEWAAAMLKLELVVAKHGGSNES